LVTSTVKAASLFAAGQAAATGIISLKVAALTEGVLKMMFLSKLKMAAALALTVALVAGGAGGLLYRTQAGEDRASTGQNRSAVQTQGQPADDKPGPSEADLNQLRAFEAKNADLEQLKKIENEARRLIAKLEAVTTAMREIDKALKKLRDREGKQTEIEALEEIKKAVDELYKKAKGQDTEPGSAQSGGATTAGDKGAPGKKSFRFESDKPWSAVFEWLTEKTGQPLVSALPVPTGTFNVVVPQHKKVTIPEIIDIINNGLISHKRLLLNRGTSFALVPTDERIDPDMVPRILIKDLQDHGKTEIVSIAYQCVALVAEDIAPEVRKQMGPFGEVVALHKANKLLLQDTVGNLLRIKKDLDDLEGKQASGGQSETYSHKCKFIRARDAEAALRSLLGIQKLTIDVQRKAENAPAATRERSYTITSDDRTNTVFVSGPPRKIAQAKVMMMLLDVGDTP
jgi:hypothetical protein